jgi:hypothetical protein
MTDTPATAQPAAEVANDPGDVFGQQIAAQQPAETHTLESAAQEIQAKMGGTIIEGPTAPTHQAPEHRAHQEPHREQHQGNGHQAHGEGNHPEEHKTKWLNKFRMDNDRVAGVALDEDRRNKLMMIAFRDAPSERVFERLADQGYEEDAEINNIFVKRLNPHRPGDSRDEAKALFHEVRNMTLEEHGLPPKTSYFISREGMR